MLIRIVLFVVATAGFTALCPPLSAATNTVELLNSLRACPATGDAWCQTARFCVGINTGFFGYYNLDKVVLDQAKGASFEVDQIGPQDIFRNLDTPLDNNKYPTQIGRKITMRFYSNLYAKTLPERMPSGEFVVLWEGRARRANVSGNGVSNVLRSRNRIQFSLDTIRRGEAIFTYESVDDGRHVTNIRIVPIAYENDYKEWSWNDYDVGAKTNPPIFFPEWLDKMQSAEGCFIRYMNSNHNNDRNVIVTKRDSSRDRIMPSYSVWYEGFAMGFDVEPWHGLPWEIIAEASLQTGTYPWINFRVYTFENLRAGDRLVRDVGTMFREKYGGPIYVEYGNEIWNYAWPFDVASDYVRYNGPGRNDNIGENYALRANVVYRAFTKAYRDRACLVQGVIAGQARNPWHAEQRVLHADREYADVVAAATYVGDNLVPDNLAWQFVEQLYDDVRLGRITQSTAFNSIRDELLTGSLEIIKKNWRNDVAPYIQAHIDIARTDNLCPAIYESGLNMRIDRSDPDNARHRNIQSFVRDYRDSPQQAEVEAEVYRWLRARKVGPTMIYSSVESSGNGTFSYWDTIFDDREDEAPRTRLIRTFADKRASLLKTVIGIERRIAALPNSAFRDASKSKTRLLATLARLGKAVHKGAPRNATRLTEAFEQRVNGCGRTPDADDWLVQCGRQRQIQRLVRRLQLELPTL